MPGIVRLHLAKVCDSLCTVRLHHRVTLIQAVLLCLDWRYRQGHPPTRHHNQHLFRLWLRTLVASSDTLETARQLFSTFKPVATLFADWRYCQGHPPTRHQRPPRPPPVPPPAVHPCCVPSSNCSFVMLETSRKPFCRFMFIAFHPQIGAIDKDSLQPAIGDPQTAACAASGCAPLLRSIERSLLRHAGNVEEMARGDTPRLLAHLLRYIMSLPLPSSSAIDAADGSLVVGRSGRGDEELVLSVIGLATATKVRVVRLSKTERRRLKDGKKEA
jgi:hypothetical protein